jgi:hypothetical protein
METSSIRIHSPPAEVVSVAVPGRRLPLLEVNMAFSLLWEVRRTLDRKDIDRSIQNAGRTEPETFLDADRYWFGLAKQRSNSL